MITAQNSSHKKAQWSFDQPTGGVKVRSTIFFFAAIASSIPLFIGAWSGANKAGEKAAMESRLVLLKNNETNSESLRKWVFEEEQSAQLMAADPIMQTVAQDPLIEARLSDMRVKSPSHLSWITVSPDGVQTNSSNRGDKINVAESAYFSSVMRGSASFVTAQVLDSTHKAALLVAVPIKFAQQITPLGVLTGLTDMDSATTPILQNHTGKTGFSFIVNANGQILAHPDAKNVGSVADPEVAALFPPSFQGRVQIVSTPNGMAQVVAREAGAGLIVVSQRSQSEINGVAASARNRFFLVIAPFWAFALALSLVAARLLSRKIERLAATLQGFGDADEPEEVSKQEARMRAVGGAKEVRNMARAIGRLAPTYRSIIARVKRSA